MAKRDSFDYSAFLAYVGFTPSTDFDTDCLILCVGDNGLSPQDLSEVGTSYTAGDPFIVALMDLDNEDRIELVEAYPAVIVEPDGLLSYAWAAVDEQEDEFYENYHGDADYVGTRVVVGYMDMIVAEDLCELSYEPRRQPVDLVNEGYYPDNTPGYCYPGDTSEYDDGYYQSGQFTAFDRELERHLEEKEKALSEGINNAPQESSKLSLMDAISDDDFIPKVTLANV